jgi:hypothetical protein
MIQTSVDHESERDDDVRRGLLAATSQHGSVARVGQIVAAADEGGARTLTEGLRNEGVDDGVDGAANVGECV